LDSNDLLLIIKIKRWVEMKIFLTIIAWFGLLLVAAASAPMLPSFLHIFQSGHSNYFNSGFGLIFGEITILGVLLALIGGFKAKPRYFWFSLIIIGAISILANLGTVRDYNDYYNYRHFSVGSLISFIPGLALIAEGIIIKFQVRSQAYDSK